MATRSQIQYWWFGINNANKRNINNKQHVIYPEIKSLLDGSQEEFEWPFHGKAKKFYGRMQQGDKVILWMGNGRPNKNWGILGFCVISNIRQGYSSEDQNKYVLKTEYIPPNPITPYNDTPKKTETVKFLQETFGLNFKPLGKTFNNVGYGTSRPIITIDEITQKQYLNTKNYSMKQGDNILEEKDIRLLSYFIEIKDNKSTATEIQSHLGYKAIGAVNLHVASLAQKLANRFSYQPGIRANDQKEWWPCLFEGESIKTGSKKYFIWQLKDEVKSWFYSTYRDMVDTVDNSIALCPNCHREKHFG